MSRFAVGDRVMAESDLNCEGAPCIGRVVDARAMWYKVLWDEGVDEFYTHDHEMELIKLPATPTKETP